MTDQTTHVPTEEAFDATGFASNFREEFKQLPASRRFTAEQLEVIYGLAYAHAQQKQWAKALPIFAFLSQYGPTRRHYLAGLAQCMRQVGRIEDAKNIYALMVLLFPEHLETGLQVAECQLALGDLSAAQATLQQMTNFLEGNHPLQQRVTSLQEQVNTRSASTAP